MTRCMIATLLCLTALAGCGPSPKPPQVLTLTIVGAKDQNPDATGAPQPLAVRVYQLSATAKFMQTDVFALKDREQQTLGTESSGSQEILVAPGETKVVKADLKPLVSSIGVAAMFQNIDASSWRAVAPVKPEGETKLTATISKLAVTLGAPKEDGMVSGALKALGIGGDAPPPAPPPAAPPAPAAPTMPTMPTAPAMPTAPTAPTLPTIPGR